MMMHCCRWVSLYFITQRCQPQFVSGPCTAAGSRYLSKNNIFCLFARLLIFPAVIGWLDFIFYFTLRL